jgi:microcystin-dependent protein
LYFQQVSDRLSDLMGSLSGGAVGDYQQTALDTLGPSWLLCDGSEVAKADYPALYELIGDMAGVAAGDGNFVLPSIDRIYAHPGDDKPIQRTFIRATV